MTDKDLAAIRTDAEEHERVLNGAHVMNSEDRQRLKAAYGERSVRNVLTLADEVERLRAFAQIIADMPPFATQPAGLSSVQGPIQYATTIYTDHDLVREARTLLAE